MEPEDKTTPQGDTQNNQDPNTQPSGNLEDKNKKSLEQSAAERLLEKEMQASASDISSNQQSQEPNQKKESYTENKKPSPPENLPVGNNQENSYAPVSPKINTQEDEKEIKKTSTKPAKPISKKEGPGSDKITPSGSPPVTFLDEKGKPEKPEVAKPERKSSIRTYYSDIAETIRGSNLSMTGIAIEESKKRERATRAVQDSPEVLEKEGGSGSWKRAIMIVFAVILVGFGAGILGYFIASLRTTESDDLPIAQEEETLIPSDLSRTIDVTGFTREDLISTLENTRDNASGGLDTIENIKLIETVPDRTNNTTRTTNARTLLEMLDAQVDSAFIRSIEPEFMLGIHAFDRDHYFLIVKTSFFENTFAGMLRWEEALAEDLPFLTKVITSSGSGLSTTTPQTLEARDALLSNRDVRMLVDSSGNPRIMYSLPNRNTLIITSNEETLKEIFERMNVRSFEQ